MTEATTENSNALVALNLNLPAPTVVAEQVNKAFHTIYGKIEEEIAAFVPDVTTEKGRQAIASLAYKIARTKTGLDEAAAAITADQKQIIDAVNGERRQMREDLDRLKASVRAPLDAWEKAEAEIKARADEAIDRLRNRSDEGKDAAELEMLLGNLQNWKITPELYGDYLEAVTGAHLDAVAYVDRLLEKRRQYEAEQIELEQLRREKAEREEKERQEREAEEARKREEEEKRRQDEERERIAKAAEEKAKRDAEEEIAALKRRAEEEEQARHNAEVMRRQAEEKAERDRIAAEEEAQRREEQAEARRKQEAKEAEERAQERERQAAERERQRIAAEKAAEEEAEAKRVADVEHRKRINVAAANALTQAGDITEQQAKAIVAAIFKGQVPHVAISY